MINPDHISESLDRNHLFGLKILKLFDADPGSGMEKIRTRDTEWKKFKSGIRDKHPATLCRTKKFLVLNKNLCCGFEF
jgi:hypothetical protein